VIPFKRYPPGFDVQGPRADGTETDRQQERVLQREYKYQMEIVNYVYLGFGMQYAFLRKFGYSTIAFGLLGASIASQWGFYWMQLIDNLHCKWLITQYCGEDTTTCGLDPNCYTDFTADQITGTFKQIQLRQACVCNTYRNFQRNNTEITERPNHARNALLVTGRLDFTTNLVMNSPAIMEALYATVPVQISIGVLLGKVSPAQMSIMSILCVTAYGVNNWVCIYMLGCYDNIGGCCIIHLFGACFGTGATVFASQKGSANNPDNQPRYNADVMAMIGTILNWMTFPSFNAYFAPAVSQQGVVVNTYLSLFSSSVWVMFFSSLYSGQFKLDPADVQRSSLAGGVAIASCASIFARPHEALIIGAFGGFVCSTAHRFVRPFFERKLMVTDTVGAISLHALPGLVAWLAGIIYVYPLGQDYRGKWSGQSFITTQTLTLPYGGEYSTTFMHSEGDGDTAIYQALMAPVTICIGTGTGIATGYVLRKISGPTVAKTFTDSMYFAVPADFVATEEQDEEPGGSGEKLQV